MSGPNPTRQKQAWKVLDQLFIERENTFVIHYSCETFYERPEGRSPRITSIAIRRLGSGQTVSFSIHQVAERSSIPFKDITAKYDELEKEMLDEFYKFAGSHRGSNFLHWNMRDINYGFAAIDHRYRVLEGEPAPIEESKKFDLSRLFIDIYGVGYADHPRLSSLLELNAIKPLDFLSGKEEAEAFERQDYAALHRSTLRKVDVLANLASRAHDRALKTRTTWWEMHGGYWRTAVNWIAGHRGFQLVAGVASILGLALTIYALR
ncbi:MAG: hypothetical protein M5U16_01285 [Hyphomicrobium sp.]|nr:hypothetical protein [Hyphomicrobium sp.]